MALHFSKEIFLTRQNHVCKMMQHKKLDALIMFRQESMYYLSGYDSFGYSFFQAMVLDAKGSLFLLTRAPDLRQAQHTSIIDDDDIYIWRDGDHRHPSYRLKDILQQKNMANLTFGVEYEAYGLTGANTKSLDEALTGFGNIIDASHLVSKIRLVKDEKEITYLKKAGSLGDHALETALPLIKAGGDEGDILSAMQGAILKAGGDYPANEFVIGSGRDALLCRYKSGRSVLQKNDQLTLEWAGVYRHYHAALMRTAVIGQPHNDHLFMFDVARNALLACEAMLRPGNFCHDVFMAHANVLDQAGLKNHRLNACGYAMGSTFAPMWMDWPMLHENNEVELKANMAFFIHIIIVNSETGHAQTLGRSSVIQANRDNILLSRLPLELIQK
ncbi:MAG: Xaa-Pro peptidase family protein [Pseudomonadota bacterium]